MINFSISFLLAFDIQKKLPKRNQIKRDKATSVQQKKRKLVLTVDDKQAEPFVASNIIGAAHIQYELVPNKCKYDIDVVCWGPVAKIFTNDGHITLVTVVENQRAWVPVCLEHYVPELSLGEVKQFHNYIIEFNIYDNIGNTDSLIRSDRIIPYPEDFTDNKLFTEIKTDPDSTSRIEHNALEKFMKTIIMKCVNAPNKDVVSWTHLPVNYDVFNDTIEKVSTGEKIECRDFVLPCSLPLQQHIVSLKTDPAAKDADLKKKAPKMADTGNIKMKVPAEIFFTDSNPAMYGLSDLTGFINSSFVFVAVDHLLTRTQKLALNPLVVKINKIDNLPADVLKNHGIESIYAAYKIPQIAQCETVTKVPASKVYFNEAHMYFSTTASKFKLTEFMQTQKLFVEIYGEVNTSERKLRCSLFGQEDDDKDISRIGPNFQHFDKDAAKKTSPVLLAIATYDISSLVDNVWDFKEKAQLHQPDITIMSKPSEYYNKMSYIDVATVNEINLVSSYSRKKCILTEATLLELGTTLQVQVYLMAPQAATLVLHQVSNIFKRIFIVYNEEKLAKSMFSEITKHNKNVYEWNKDEKVKDTVNSDILTGFVIDSGTSFFFYIEGPSTGFILNIWHDVDCRDVRSCKVFFNTDNAFEQRLYGHFFDQGMYVITLRLPFHDILSIPGLYYGKVPAPCMKALMKLSLLFDSPNFKTIMQQNLLPKAEELMSLNLEWGVPLRWKQICS